MKELRCSGLPNSGVKQKREEGERGRKVAKTSKIHGNSCFPGYNESRNTFSVSWSLFSIPIFASLITSIHLVCEGV